MKNKKIKQMIKKNSDWHKKNLTDVENFGSSEIGKQERHSVLSCQALKGIWPEFFPISFIKL